MPKSRKGRGRAGRIPLNLPTIFKQISPEVETELRAGPYAALNAIEDGRGAAVHASTVSDAVYLALELRKHAAPDEAIDLVIADAMAAGRRMTERHFESLVWSVTPAEAEALREALKVCESLQKICTQREIALACRIVDRGTGRKR